MSKRLFVAVAADSLYSAALPYVKKLKTSFGQKDIDVQWAPQENWHITLMFLGEIQAPQISAIAEALQTVSAQTPAFKLKIHDFGAFPDPHKARVIWMGVQRSQALLNLQSSVELSLRELGFSVDDREYWPHLTIGRLRNHRHVVDALSPVVRKDIGKLQVTELVLYESFLGGPYPKYKALQKFVFQGVPAEA